MARKYFRVKAGEGVTLKEWGTTRLNNAYGYQQHNRGRDAHFMNNSGLDMFLPDGSTDERGRVFDFLGSAPGVTKYGDNGGYLLSPLVNNAAYYRLLPLWGTSKDVNEMSDWLTDVSAGYAVNRFYSNSVAYAQYNDGSFVGCWSGPSHAVGPFANLPACPGLFTQESVTETANMTTYLDFGSGQEQDLTTNPTAALIYHLSDSWQFYQSFGYGCALPGYPYMDVTVRRCYVNAQSYKYTWGFSSPNGVEDPNQWTRYITNEIIIGTFDSMQSNSYVNFGSFELKQITMDGYYYPGLTWGDWDGVSHLTVTILEKTRFMAWDSYTPAFTLNGTYPNGITINNYGGVIGGGGDGGAGGGGQYTEPGDNQYYAGYAGSGGGTAVYIATTSTVTWNNKLGLCGTGLPIQDQGYVIGGGGGGGGGCVGSRGGGGGGGGGLGGVPGGAGGAGGPFDLNYYILGQYGGPNNGAPGSQGAQGVKYRVAPASCLHFQLVYGGQGGAPALRDGSTGGGGAGGAGGLKGAAGGAGGDGDTTPFSRLHGGAGGAGGAMFQNTNANFTFNDCTPSYSAGAIN